MRGLRSFSRRHFVGYGAASMALSPFSARAQNELAPIAAATDTAQHLTIAVQINGRGPFHFVVDTGAERSVLSEDVAVALGLIRGTRVMVEGVVRTLPADTVKVAELAVGPVTRQNLSLPVLPRSLLLADGYLGLDVIDGYRVVLDFRNSALILTKPLRNPPQFMWYGTRRPDETVSSGTSRPNEIMVPVVGQHGHLYAFDCHIDGIRAVTFLDTGAELSVGNSQLFDALVKNDPSYFMPVTVPLTGVTGGTITGRVTTLKYVRMNALSFDSRNVAIADLQIFDLWGLSDRPALLIGMDWLRRFSSVSIDYSRKELRFNLARRDGSLVALNT